MQKQTSTVLFYLTPETSEANLKSLPVFQIKFHWGRISIKQFYGENCFLNEGSRQRLVIFHNVEMIK